VARAIFLDRDGVINPDTGHPHRTADAVLFPDVAPGLLRLQEAGYRLVVVSNQSGVARGLFELDQVVRFNAVLVAALNREGVSIQIEHFFVCPHAPADRCQCRKPKPGLLVAAAESLDLSFGGSFLVGDAESDVEAGRAAGVATILLNRHRHPVITQADWVLHDLNEVADLVQRHRPF
jgi:D-glycero-D-manno-heptose 1,7-bisphosphate phosphatase